MLLVLLFLSVFSFSRMVKYGMYSTQDFHIFRLIQFDKCFKDFQLPCRWSPDSGLGYGEPMFNFYGQASYAVGELVHILGFNFIDTTKILFASSLVASAVSMYFLSKKLWGSELSAIVSSILYLYAPYRAVDVWVRGALPESFSFVLFPLIILSIEYKSFVWLSILSSLLIINHNLSALMFLPVIIVWLFYRKFWKGFLSGVVSVLISSFYVLPVIFESKYINIASTSAGYFDFHNHFATLHELFISNFWGYGASVWGPKDDLSLSVGYVQWIVPSLLFLFFLVYSKFKKVGESAKNIFLIMFVLGYCFLFLTHNKSTMVWETFEFMKYIQFPWRFLSMVVFCFSISAGYFASAPSKYHKLIAVLIIVVSILLNKPFFREDIWYSVDDKFYTTGAEWNRQRTASIGDFWPIFGKVPNNPPESYFGNWQPVIAKSNYFKFNIDIDKDSEITLPVTYFPGWEARVNGSLASISPSIDKGNIKIYLTHGLNIVDLEFKNTPVRTLGNIISLVSLIALFCFKVIWKEKT